MSKERNSKKEVKKAPAKSLKEKKADKQARKGAADTIQPIIPK